MELRTRNFLGQSGFIWVLGIVENRADPEGRNRIQVRCFGIHTPDKELLPTEDLPWSTPIMPLNASDDPMDVVEGDLVLGFAIDALELQEFSFLGVIQSNNGGFISNVNGFTDPRTDLSNAPRKPKAYEEDGQFEDGTAQNTSTGKSEYQLNSYAKGTTTLASQAKSVQRVSNIPIIGGNLSEPANPFAPVYPYNKAKESESGHAWEIDDTPGHERIHIFHRTGSFIELHPDGTVVRKSTKNDYEITLGDRVVYTRGKTSLSSNGMSHLNIGDYDLEVNGTVNIVINGNAIQKISGTNVVEASSHLIKGNVRHEGEWNSTGQIKSDTDVVAKNISLTKHPHGGVQRGGGVTDPPIGS